MIDGNFFSQGDSDGKSSEENGQRAIRQVLPSRQRARIPLSSRIQIDPTQQKVQLPRKVKSSHRFVCRTGRMVTSRCKIYASAESDCWSGFGAYQVYCECHYFCRGHCE